MFGTCTHKKEEKKPNHFLISSELLGINMIVISFKPKNLTINTHRIFNVSAIRTKEGLND